jgi:acyl-coenzyme A thioesterase PaaI-like protein
VSDDAPRESWATRVARWGFNRIPAYRATGARITFLRDDWREVRLVLPLRRGTRNLMGTLFGGSLYGAVDPIAAVMIMKNLGPGHVVWVKSSTIRFLRPGRTTLHARHVLAEHELREIRDAVAAAGRCERTAAIELVDAEGVVHVRCEQELSVRTANP